MEWNVLAVGDVVAGCGVSMIEKHLPQLRRQVKADFTVVNGENAAILGITLGRQGSDLVGEDAADATGVRHPGIIRTPVPVLSGRPETFQTLRRQLAELEFADVAAVDFTDLAQSCRTYGEFIEKMARTGPGELRYLGMALLGPRHQVDRLTGSLPLLR